MKPKFLRAVESRISSAVEHFTRNEGVPSSNLGFGSKVQGRKARDANEKPPQSHLQAVFSWRIVARESEADFRKRPCGKQPREDERSDVKFGFGARRGGVRGLPFLRPTTRPQGPGRKRKTAAKPFAGSFFITCRSPENKPTGPIQTNKVIPSGLLPRTAFFPIFGKTNRP